MFIKFGTKAENLISVSPFLKNANVLPQVSFTVDRWNNSSNEVIKELELLGWDSKYLIIRSSSQCEDTLLHSNAGEFLSIQNVYGVDNISNAIIKVIASYNDNNPENQVLIQPMLTDIIQSGVVFTRDPNTGGNYYVINYDESSHSDTVTSGSAGNLKTVFIFKDDFKDNVTDKYISKICALAEELENLYGTDKIDIEYAITQDKIYLLQIRPLILGPSIEADISKQKEVLNEIASKITQMNMVHPYLYGRKTILGVMPDWNPAEMIGTYPKTLALSLYEELITNNIWSKQRKRYGYRDVTDFPLLYDLGGIPYIDVRVSFNSFIPAGLPEDIGRKLCEYYIEKLTKNPNLHDKIEFEIVFSNFSFDIFDRAKALKKAGFKADEIEILISVLLEQTKKIIDDIWEDDIKKMKSLDNRRKKIMNSGLDDIAKIYWLLSDCKKYGTLPFAGLARMGFIAIQFLKSLKNIGIISEEDYFNFMGSLNLISSNIQYDKHHLSQAQFLSKYGHLRPGTYDILSHRYDEDYDKYFGKTKYLKIDLKEHRKSDFNFSDHQKVKINRILAEYNFKQSADEFIQLMKKAIEAREYSKFIFSHSVSDILRCIENISRENGICIEDAAFLNIKDIIQLYTSSGNIKRALEYSYKKGKQKYLITKQIKLPTLIINNKDIKIFSLLKSEPNFITQERVIGKVTLNMEENIEDNIVFLPSADPGFDWIFTHNIKGFVTMFGGANSHMAIRAGELGIPAVIGAGEKLYNIWSNYDFLELNCQNKYVKEVLLSSLSRDSYI